MKIEAIANIDNKIFDCSGDLEIHSVKGPQAYVTWTLCSGDILVASKSANYFVGRNYNELELIQKIVNGIENYRIGRRKIFNHVIVK
ncbi:hypothetical protein [Pinibacter soli]|uniref:Uncharacterized protein n=1 Tax=Pinibacter soli TaxID=3044211 RepID=A0ABT6RDM3_9BACT|nr:hypothetical protein [Pinibacter soli]MDI3320674.1 hypothetical protein [Pinibacter soli]